MTNDIDVVLALDDAARTALLRTFPETEFYVPPESVIRAEQARNQRGHFNLIHHDSGYKADIYLAGADPLHAWRWPCGGNALERRPGKYPVAPPEYVVLRKLEFYREGHSAKHPADIRAIREITGVDGSPMAPWLERAGLKSLWQDLTA